MNDNSNDLIQNQNVDENYSPEENNDENQLNSEPEVQNLSQKQLKQIAKLHKECAKYRTALNASNAEYADLKSLFQNLQVQFDTVSKQKNNQDYIHKLENLGCLKPELVLKDIPDDCQNFDEFINEYQINNPFLFKKTKYRHGFSFRGSKSSNYTASQQMNNYIRSALGR
ncbi:hypothetical protein IJG14_00225 [bacterium]|nr:hypothetical protein [bacterium]